MAQDEDSFDPEAPEERSLDPSEGVETRNWRRQLSEDYRQPDKQISIRSALSHRLRRVYFPILSGLLLVWLFRVSAADGAFLEAAAIETLPGWVVVVIVALAYGFFLVLTLLSLGKAQPETDESVDHGDL